MLLAALSLAACASQDLMPDKAAPLLEGNRPATTDKQATATKPPDISDPGPKTARAASVETAPPSEAKKRIEVTPAPPVAKEPAKTASTAAAPPAIKVGLLLPLSGPQGAIGRALRDAATMALFDLAEGRLELLPRDTGGTAAGAAAAARAVLDEGATLLLGPLLSDSVSAVAPIALERRVNVIAFSSDDGVARPGVYLLSFTPQQEVSRIIRHARLADIERFAALVPDSAYGRAVVAALKTALSLHGGVLLQIEYYPASGKGAARAVQRLAHFRERRSALERRRRELEAADTVESLRELRRMKELETLGTLDYQAILLPEGGQVLTRIAPLLPYYDINMRKVKLLGTGLWDDASIVREPVLHGGTYAAPPPAAFRAFRQRHEEMFGDPPPRLASLAYDAVAMAAVLSQGPEPLGFGAEALTLADGFDGSDGLFRFRPDGRMDRGLAVLEITPDGVKVRVAAPETFDDLTN